MRYAICFVLMWLTVLPIQLAAEEKEDGENPKETFVTVIDIDKVFREHLKFQKQMQDLESEQLEFDKKMETETQQLAEQRVRLLKHKPFSDSYNKLEEEIVTGEAKIEVLKKLMKQRLRRRQANLYVEGYSEIQNVVQDIMRKWNIRLVINYNSDPISAVRCTPNEATPSFNHPLVGSSHISIFGGAHIIQPEKSKQVTPDDTMTRIKQTVVEHRNLDITDETIKRINKGQHANPETTVRGF